MQAHETPALAALYEAYFCAERAWEGALVTRFGDDASQARYEARGRGSFDCDLGKSFLACRKAQNYYFAALGRQSAAPVPTIHHDNGAALGRRTRFFRDCQTTGAIQWLYGADYANGSSDWLTYYPGAGLSVADLIKQGMFLSRLA